MQLVINIPDSLVPGITFARNAANAAMPATIEGDDGPVPNPALFATDSAYAIARFTDVLNSWKQQADAAVAAPAPAPAPISLGGVPQEVTRKQGRAALILAGKLDLVQAAIDAIPDTTQRALTQNAWDSAQTFQRHDPFLLMLGGALGFTDEDLDALFVTAASL